MSTLAIWCHVVQSCDSRFYSLLFDAFQSRTLPISLYCCDFMEFDKYVFLPGRA